MTAKLASDEGKACYAKRNQTVEPVFGQVKDVRGARRFQRRGLRACQSEWRPLTRNITPGNRCSCGSVGSCVLSCLGGGIVVADKRPTPSCRRTPNGHGRAPPLPTTTE